MKSLLTGDELKEEEEEGTVKITKIKKKMTPWETYRRIIDVEDFDKIRMRIYSLEGKFA